MDNTVRQFVSFGGTCPFNCSHCYTFSPSYKSDDSNDINDIVASIKREKLKIVYVSGHRENFVNPDDGLSLCEAIFKRINVDLLITTRNVFSDEQLQRLFDLSLEMKKASCDLFVCSSIPATKSYKALEPSPLMPTPQARMNFLKQVFDMGIYTILTIRPLCPNSFIPIEEPLEIIDYCHEFSSVILSSGIVVDDAILNRLVSFPFFKCNGEEPLMTCLLNDMMVKYVNVDEELGIISKHCKKYGKELFYHSLPAINFLKSQNY